jgi:hypothetical protein
MDEAQDKLAPLGYLDGFAPPAMRNMRLRQALRMIVIAALLWAEAAFAIIGVFSLFHGACR